DAAGGAHRQRPTDRVHRLGRAHRDHRHLAPLLLDDLQAGLDRVLVARVEDEIDALANKTLAFRMKLARRVGIGDLLDADDNIHGWLLQLWSKPPLANICL